MAKDGTRKKVVALSSSVRSYGNSRKLADALLEGAAEAGHETELVHLGEHVSGLFRDCESCRKADGHCAIEDGYRDILINKVVPADAIVYATPVYWYGVSSHLKNFLDRFFCYMDEACPDADTFLEGIKHKKAALVMSAEENNISARLANVQQMTQLCDYLHHEFVGIVCTTANSRNDVSSDPTGPLEEARQLGRVLFDITETNYKIDTVRDGKIWQGDTSAYKHPAYWR